MKRCVVVSRAALLLGLGGVPKLVFTGGAYRGRPVLGHDLRDGDSLPLVHDQRMGHQLGYREVARVPLLMARAPAYGKKRT